MARRSTGASPESFSAARREVIGFWGGNGSDESFRLVRTALGGRRLSAEQLDQLRLELPAATGAGTTAQRIRRMDSLLLRLHAAA